MAKVTADDVAEGEAALAKVKQGKHDPIALRAAMDRLAEVRSAWREQEQAAGRRTGIVSTEG